MIALIAAVFGFGGIAARAAGSPRSCFRVLSSWRWRASSSTPLRVGMTAGRQILAHWAAPTPAARLRHEKPPRLREQLVHAPGCCGPCCWSPWAFHPGAVAARFSRLQPSSGSWRCAAQVYKVQIDPSTPSWRWCSTPETGVRGYLLNDRKPVCLDAYAPGVTSSLCWRAHRGRLPARQRRPPGVRDPGPADPPQARPCSPTHGRRRPRDQRRPPGQGGTGRAPTWTRSASRSGAARRALGARNQTRWSTGPSSVSADGARRHRAGPGRPPGLIVALFGVQQRQATLRAPPRPRCSSGRNVAPQVDSLPAHPRLSDLASYLTDAREAERARLARELHDELGALLTAAKMDASWLLRSLGATAGPDIQARFRRLIDTIGSGITIKAAHHRRPAPAAAPGPRPGGGLRALTDELRGEYQLTLHLPASEPPPHRRAVPWPCSASSRNPSPTPTQVRPRPPHRGRAGAASATCCTCGWRRRRRLRPRQPAAQPPRAGRHEAPDADVRGRFAVKLGPGRAPGRRPDATAPPARQSRPSCRGVGRRPPARRCWPPRASRGGASGRCSPS